MTRDERAKLEKLAEQWEADPSTLRWVNVGYQRAAEELRELIGTFPAKGTNASMARCKAGWHFYVSDCRTAGITYRRPTLTEVNAATEWVDGSGPMTGRSMKHYADLLAYYRRHEQAWPLEYIPQNDLDRILKDERKYRTWRK